MRSENEKKDDCAGEARERQAVVGNSTLEREADLTARLGSARLGSARLGSARLGSARLGSARLGSARLGSARLGSARLGSARLIIGDAKRSLDVKSFVEPSILFSLRVVATGKSRAHGDGSDRSHRCPLPISAAPHDTGVSGFVEVSQDT